MQFKYIDQLLQKEWENQVRENPFSGFMQSCFWTKFANLLNWPTFKIGLFDKNKLIGGAVVTKFTSGKNNYLYIPEGPVLPFEEKKAEEMFHSLIREADKIADLKGENLTSHLRIEPKLTNLPSFFNRFQKAPINEQPLSTLIVDLTLNEEELLRQMKPKGRYNIKVAKRHGIEVVSKDLAGGMSDFLEFYQQTVERKRFEGKDESYFYRLIDACEDPSLAKFFFAKRQNEILAAALIIFYGNLATFLFGASSDKYPETMAPYLLHWEIMRHAKDAGFKKYDFLGVAPDEDDESHPWHGFTVFKKKFGGKQINYIGAYDFVYNKKLYEDYLRENGEKTSGLPFWFGGRLRTWFR